MAKTPIGTKSGGGQRAREAGGNGKVDRKAPGASGKRTRSARTKSAPAKSAQTRKPGRRGRRVRYGVVGLGYISQVAVLPAFAHARNSELTALVSSDATKLKKLGAKYKVAGRYSYEQYDELLESGTIDAVYIGLPNNLHKEYAVRAARAGIHVLCEKPMAISADECQDMMDAANAGNAKLMIAYRLHFERANMTAVDIVRSGKIGEPRIFSSDFTMQVRDEDNIRLDADKGGGTLWDIGIYCINAARYLFRSEPLEVVACTASRPDQRFEEVEEMASCILRFPGERLASFTCSFGAADVSSYRVIGTLGDVRVEPAYEYAEGLSLHVTIDGRTRERKFEKRDQFAAELVHFSECVLEDREPQPSGREGLADVRIIEALYQSARKQKPVSIEMHPPARRPSLATEITRPPVKEPELVHANSPGGKGD